jgi:hypothetical protein
MQTCLVLILSVFSVQCTKVKEQAKIKVASVKGYSYFGNLKNATAFSFYEEKKVTIKDCENYAIITETQKVRDFFANLGFDSTCKISDHAIIHIKNKTYLVLSGYFPKFYNAKIDNTPHHCTLLQYEVGMAHVVPTCLLEEPQIRDSFLTINNNKNILYITGSMIDSSHKQMTYSFNSHGKSQLKEILKLDRGIVNYNYELKLFVSSGEKVFIHWDNLDDEIPPIDPSDIIVLRKDKESYHIEQFIDLKDTTTFGNSFGEVFDFKDQLYFSCKSSKSQDVSKLLYEFKYYAAEFEGQLLSYNIGSKAELKLNTSTQKYLCQEYLMLGYRRHWESLITLNNSRYFYTAMVNGKPHLFYLTFSANLINKRFYNLFRINLTSMDENLKTHHIYEGMLELLFNEQETSKPEQILVAFKNKYHVELIDFKTSEENSHLFIYIEHKQKKSLADRHALYHFDLNDDTHSYTHGRPPVDLIDEEWLRVHGSAKTIDIQHKRQGLQLETADVKGVVRYLSIDINKDDIKFLVINDDDSIPVANMVYVRK